MNNYTFTFYGKTTGAIGTAGKHTATRTADSEDATRTADSEDAARTADSEDAARLALYDEFEHIIVTKVDVEPAEPTQA